MGRPSRRRASSGLAPGVPRRYAVDMSIPGSVEECYSLAMQAFDLAEKFQTPIFLMSAVWNDANGASARDCTFGMVSAGTRAPVVRRATAAAGTG